MSLLDEMRAHYGATADELAALGRSAGVSTAPVTEADDGEDLLVMWERLERRVLRSIMSMPIEALGLRDQAFVLKVANAGANEVRARRAAANEMPLVVVPPTRDAVIEACMRAVGPIALA